MFISAWTSYTSMSEVTEVKVKGITAKSLTLCALIFIVTYAIFLFSFHPRVAGPDYWFWHYIPYLGWRWYFGWQTILFPLMVIISLLTLVSRKFMLTKQEWTIVYAVATVVVPSTFWWGIWAWCMNGMLGTEKYKWLIEYLPPTWAPRDYEILAAYHASRSPWEWSIPYAGEWAVPIVMWVLFYLFVNIWLYGLVLIFRKRMIEIEKLPYPVTTTTLTVINMVTTPVSEGSRRTIIWSKKALLFWIGLIIAIVHDLFYEFPTLIFKKPPINIAEWYKPIPRPEPFQRSVTSYSICLEDIGLGFLFPLDILFTGVLFHWIFLVLLPAIMVSAGVVPTEKRDPGWGSLWAMYFGRDWPGALAYMFNAMTFGVAMYLLFYTRDTWIGLFKKFLRGEEEPGEPVSPRMMWSLFLLGMVVFIIWMVISGIHIVATLATIPYIIVVWFAVIRYAGEAWGPGLLPWGFRIQQYDREYSWIVTSALGLNKSVTGYGMGYVLSNLTCYQPHSSVIPGIFSYKIALETNTDPKEVFKVQLPTIILASILSVVIGWYTIGVQGLRNWEHSWTTSWDGALNNGLGAGQSVVKWTEVHPVRWQAAWVGAILGIILMFLRTTFAWFIINPIAIPLLSLLNFYGYISYTIAFIIKLIVLKVFGVRIYSEYAVPFFVGLFFGSFIMYHWGYPLFLWMWLGKRWIPI